MDITLKQITMRNFRKYADDTFSFEGDSVIEAANGLGKSTILNAFLWCLTGKDMDGKTESADFRTAGAPPEVAPSVSITLSIDGIDTEFTRRLEPTYTGRGLDKAYKGDQTVCLVSGVPKAVGEYKTYLDSIFPVNPALWLDVYFFADDAKFPVEDRRKLLVDAFGNVSDEDVFASDIRFAELRDAKGALSVDDFKLKEKEIEKACTAALGRGKTVGTLQARIDEAYRSIVNGVTVADEEAHIKRIEADISAQSKTSEDAFIQKRKDTENKLRDLQRKEEVRRKDEFEATFRSWSQKNAELRAEMDKLLDEKKTVDNAYGYALVDYDNLSHDLLVAENDLMGILSDNYEPNEICPTCGQKIPKKMLDEAAENYYEQRAIKQERTEKRIAEIKDLIEKTNKKADDCRTRLDGLDAEIAPLSRMIENHNATRPEMPPLSKDFLKQQAALQSVLDTLVAPLVDHERIAALTAELKTHQGNLAQAQMNEKQLARIKELQAEQVRTNEALLEAQRLIALCDEFSVAKAHRIEDEIASHFNGVRFELFSFYKNHEVKNSCRPIVDGKPYRILSFSQKILASAAIVEGLSKHFDFCAPLFIDNTSELDSRSIATLTAMRNQTIFIKVSENPLTVYSI